MSNPRPFYLGLCLTTFITLTLEIINSRLYSVITWYHLGFFAISVAMLGMTAGALWVYFRPQIFTPHSAPRQLYVHSMAMAWAIPLSHIVTIQLRPSQMIEWSDPSQLGVFLSMTIVTAIPFVISGVLVSVALTKVKAPIGRVYAADLLGAAAGCLGAVALMELMDPSSATFLLGALSALAALAFQRCDPSAGRARLVAPATAFILEALSLLNSGLYPGMISLRHSKGYNIPSDCILDRWNSHSRIIAKPLEPRIPPYWDPGEGAPMDRHPASMMLIDGAAGTVLYPYGGDAKLLEWAKYDVTNAAYYLRGKGGEVAVIGVGGGRDILSALAFDCAHVTGVELNRIFLDNLTRDKEIAGFVGVNTDPRVTLEHGEGRRYMTRTSKRFDLIQMSLIDTWASTSAGAMTLSENGLYTVEGWRGFIGALKPSGVFTVSRWFAPKVAGETARLVSLATAALIETGARDPRAQMLLISRTRVSTMVVSPTPFTAEDLKVYAEVCGRFKYKPIIIPGEPIKDPLIARIADSKTLDELRVNTRDPRFDFTPPYDANPFFFSILRPSAWLGKDSSEKGVGGIVQGNLYAGNTLLGLGLCVLILTLLAIILPLALMGRSHGLSAGRLGAGLVYFSLIGVGFMLIEIALMQRFSILLGHPVYSLVVTLFSLILGSGIGSLYSDRIFAKGGARLFLLPVVVFAMTAGLAAALQPSIDAATRAPFWAQIVFVCAVMAPLGAALGCCFPVGMGLVGKSSERALPWMWGINGACGVMGSVVAMILSMAYSITGALLVGAFCYLALLAPLALLARDPGEKGAA